MFLCELLLLKEALFPLQLLSVTADPDAAAACVGEKLCFCHCCFSGRRWSLVLRAGHSDLPFSALGFCGGCSAQESPPYGQWRGEHGDTGTTLILSCAQLSQQVLGQDASAPSQSGSRQPPGALLYHYCCSYITQTHLYLRTFACAVFPGWTTCLTPSFSFIYCQLLREVLSGHSLCPSQLNFSLIIS